MKIFVFLILYFGSLKAESVFVSPIADFKEQTFILSFLPDIQLSTTVKECWILSNKTALYKFPVNLVLKPLLKPETFEKRIKFPAGIKDLNDLDGTELRCFPGVFKISTWRLEGLNES